MAALGLYVRVWCTRCSRGREFAAAHVPADFARRPLRAVLLRLRCRVCGRADASLIVPASPLDQAGSHKQLTIEAAVAAFFHTHRSLRKREKQLARRRGKDAQAQFSLESPPANLVMIDGVCIESRAISLDSKTCR